MAQLASARLSAREVSYVDFQCNCIVAFAGENPSSFHLENLLQINLVTLTDE